jgi:hypothetical protein
MVHILVLKTKNRQDKNVLLMRKPDETWDIGQGYLPWLSLQSLERCGVTSPTKSEIVAISSLLQLKEQWSLRPFTIIL